MDMQLELVVPIYKDGELIENVFEFTEKLVDRLKRDISLCIVVDGDEDGSSSLFKLQKEKFKKIKSRAVILSRNFGVGPAIKAGIATSEAEITIVFGADLQEPLELFEKFYIELTQNHYHLVLGSRISRRESFISRSFSKLFWILMRVLVSRKIPSGGFDIFASTKKFNEVLVEINLKNSNILAELLSLGFESKYIEFHREIRKKGVSKWSFYKKLKLAFNTFFLFSTLVYKIIILMNFLLLTIMILTYFYFLQFAITILVLFLIIILNFNIFIFYLQRIFKNQNSLPLYIIQDIIK